MSGNPSYDQPMALYVIERSFADQLDLTDDDVELIEEINATRECAGCSHS